MKDWWPDPGPIHCCLLYTSGEVDVATSLPSTVMDLYEGQEDLMVTEQIATRYIYFNLETEPFDDVRVREAFNLAINREDLCRKVGADTEPTYNLVSKYMKDTVPQQPPTMFTSPRRIYSPTSPANISGVSS